VYQFNVFRKQGILTFTGQFNRKFTDFYTIKEDFSLKQGPLMELSTIILKIKILNLKVLNLKLKRFNTEKLKNITEKIFQMRYLQES
jgi:hypothetical protein